MPIRKFSADDIVEAAFRVIRKYGLEKFSARSIASELGSSTMPLYSGHRSMKDLEEAITKGATDLLLEYQTKERTGRGFLDMGVGYVMFAMEEKNLFRMMLFREPGDEG